jgi:site-specific DNA-methyltransferase (adenine-specific)
MRGGKFGASAGALRDDLGIVTRRTPDNGRWPANVIHDGSDEVVGMFPDSESTGGDGYKNSIFCGGQKTGGHGLGDSGSAARFFYCAKASQEDRNEGLENLPMLSAGDVTDRVDGSAGLNSPRAGAGRANGSRNFHPTVKPTELMRYLCRLVTPPNGIVLDPFCGSGSTGKAAFLEHLRFIGIELSADYCEITKLRIEAVTKQGRLFANA